MGCNCNSLALLFWTRLKNCDSGSGGLHMLCEVCILHNGRLNWICHLIQRNRELCILKIWLFLEYFTFLTFLMFQKLGFYHWPPESQIEFDHSSLIILTLRGIWHRGEGDHAKLYCYFAKQRCRGVSIFAKSVVLKPSGALFVFPSFLEPSHVQWSIWLLFQTFKWQKYAKILKTLVSFLN